MQCTNCGAQLMGIEHACPVCGRPLPTPAPQPNMASPDVVQQVADPNQVTTPPVSNMTPATIPEAAPTNKKEKDNKGLIIIICIAIVVLLGIMVYFVVFAGGKSDNASQTTSTSEPTPADDTTQSSPTVNYAGYTFSVPATYKTKKSDIYGLIIYNDSEMFSIAIDYSNNYDAYKASLTQTYPELANSITTVSGREFIPLILTNEDSSKATQYVTKKDETTTMVGLVLRSDKQPPTTSEFSDLASIIDSGMVNPSETVTPGDALDAGTRIGIITYTVDPSVFSFEAKEGQ